MQTRTEDKETNFEHILLASREHAPIRAGGSGSGVFGLGVGEAI